jgi:hypothetical protein
MPENDDAAVSEGAEALEVAHEEAPMDADSYAALEEMDRSNKIGRTTIQAGAAAALVTVFEFVAAYFSLDLDPRADGVQDSFPPVFTAALFTLLAWAAARVMNPKK